jgi:hypothetical protein
LKATYSISSKDDAALFNCSLFRAVLKLLSRFRAENPNHYTERWKSTTIVERKMANVVMTKKTPYVLEGKLSFSHAHDSGLPTFVILAFKVRFAVIETSTVALIS